MAEFLRRWRRDDAAALADIYARADAELTSNIPDDRTLTGAQAWLERGLEAAAEGTTVAFAIMRDGTSPADSKNSVGNENPVGNVMATGIERRHSTAWISYWLEPDARGLGLASAGLRSLVDHLHDEIDVYRLELGYRISNPASAAVARASGFLVEGRERERLLYDGIRYDTEVAARLAGDRRASGRRLSVGSPDDGGDSESR